MFSDFREKKMFAPRNGWERERGWLTLPCHPPPFSLVLYYEHIMNICFSCKFALRIASVLSSFRHAI